MAFPCYVDLKLLYTLMECYLCYHMLQSKVGVADLQLELHMLEADMVDTEWKDSIRESVYNLVSNLVLQDLG